MPLRTPCDQRWYESSRLAILSLSPQETPPHNQLVLPFVSLQVDRKRTILRHLIRPPGIIAQKSKGSIWMNLHVWDGTDRPRGLGGGDSKVFGSMPTVNSPSAFRVIGSCVRWTPQPPTAGPARCSSASGSASRSSRPAPPSCTLSW